MQVIVIHEDFHGMIGIAKDYESAIDFLFQKHWFDLEFSLEDLNISIDDIKKMSIDEFNTSFDCWFHLEVDNVWGM